MIVRWPKDAAPTGIGDLAAPVIGLGADRIRADTGDPIDTPTAGMAARQAIGAGPGAIAGTRPTMDGCLAAAGNKLDNSSTALPGATRDDERP